VRRQKAEMGPRKLKKKVISPKILGDEVRIKWVIYAVREVEMIDLYTGLHLVETPNGKTLLGKHKERRKYNFRMPFRRRVKGEGRSLFKWLRAGSYGGLTWIR
jgi:hypothetical protein